MNKSNIVNVVNAFCPKYSYGVTLLPYIVTHNIEKKNGQRRCKYLVLGMDTSYFVKQSTVIL